MAVSSAPWNKKKTCYVIYLSLFLSPLQEVGSIIGKVSTILSSIHCFMTSLFGWEYKGLLPNILWFITERGVCQEDERRGKFTRGDI